MKNTLVLLGILLTISSTAQKTWIGKGAGGTGTNFNTAANWSPTGIPGAADNVIIAITSNATIAMTANASIKNLTLTISGNNKNAVLDVDNNTLTVNGTATIDALSGNPLTYVLIGPTDGISGGIIDFKGNVTLGNSGVGAAAYFAGNVNSKLIFRGNLTLGDDAIISTSASLIPGTVEFDGTGTQNILWNNTANYVRFNNIVIGNTNNPTVNLLTGTYTPDNFLGNLTVNGSSVLNLGTSFWNRNSAGGTLTMNGTSVMKLSNNSGGQGASNFPANLSSYALNAASTVEYNGTMAQTIYAVPSTGYGGLTVTNNSTKTAGGNFSVRGPLMINSTATFASGAGLTLQVGGNWTRTGNFTPSTGTVTFNGSSQQSISGAGTTTFYNLTFNNSANNSGGDIILNNVDAIVTNTGTFTDGIVNSLTSNMLIFNNGATSTGAGAASFVNVKVRKIGNSAFSFPVGKINAGYMRCTISAPSSATDAFTAEYKRSSAVTLGTIIAAGLSRVSACEYWTLDRTVGSSNVNVSLWWSGLNACNAATYVTLLSSLVVSHFNGTNWNTYGNNGGTSGTVLSGSVTWNSVSSYGQFTLGSTSAITNPLPVKFSTVSAFPVAAGNQVQWSNLTEEDLTGYVVEHSVDGVTFTTVSSVLPKTNDGQRQQYSVTDTHLSAGSTYYRIKAVQTDGSYLYSVIVKVDDRSASAASLTIYPNPVVTDQFSVQLDNYKKGNYGIRLLSSNGQALMTKNIRHTGGSLTVVMDRPSIVKAGLYIVEVIGENGIENRKLLFR